jgi:hypothetical protein
MQSSPRPSPFPSGRCQPAPLALPAAGSQRTPCRNQSHPGLPRPRPRPQRAAEPAHRDGQLLVGRRDAAALRGVRRQLRLPLRVRRAPAAAAVAAAAEVVRVAAGHEGARACAGVRGGVAGGHGVVAPEDHGAGVEDQQVAADVLGLRRAGAHAALLRARRRCGGRGEGAWGGSGGWGRGGSGSGGGGGVGRREGSSSAAGLLLSACGAV